MQGLQMIPCGNTNHGATDNMRLGVSHRARKSNREVTRDEAVTEKLEK